MDSRQLKEVISIGKVSELYGIDLKPVDTWQKCPFCQGTNTLRVTKGKFYYCCKCYKRGDIYKLLEDSGITKSFAESYREILAKVGNSKDARVYNQRLNDYEQVFSVYQAEAAKHWEVVEEYGQARGWSLQKGEVGLAYSKSPLLSAGIPKEVLVDLELYNEEYKAEYYTEHLIFPIRTATDRVVHFSGRALGESTLRWKHTKGPVPINSFAYSKVKSNAERTFICEGISDSRSLIELGESVLGIFGVSMPLTTHLDTLADSQALIAVFDRDKYALGTDKAGQYKSWSVITPHLIDLQVVSGIPVYYLMTPDLPGIKDVNEFLLDNDYDKNEFGLWADSKKPLAQLAMNIYREDIKSHHLIWKALTSTRDEVVRRSLVCRFERQVLEEYFSWPNYLLRLHG